ncbi:MAG TPA: hypothetical protein VFK32_07905 [Tepidiformaceae bacterium]|nr:hypothetical protein [Tepidiformaceae bacterium]
MAADLTALVALKNNRDRIYPDAAIAQSVISGAERIAVERSKNDASKAQPAITADDVASAMKSAGLAFRKEDYVCDIVAWVKPETVFDTQWGD